MKKLRKLLSVISALAMLITTCNINVYASEDEISLEDMILASSMIYQNDFESITDSQISDWNNNYSHDISMHFKTYHDSSYVNTDDALYSDDNGKAMYIARGKTSYSERAMQYIVADEDEETIRDGAYSLSFDYYPSRGTNRISLVGVSGVSESMASYKSGTSLVQKSFAANAREWLKVNIVVDMDNDKATITMDSKNTNENIYANEVEYSENDLRVVNFYINNSQVCSAANTAIIDNIVFSKLVLKPEVKFSIVDREDNETTDFSEAFTAVKSIKVDFGMEMNPQSLNPDTIQIINKTTESTVDYSFDYQSGGVYIMTPVALDELTDYEIVVTDSAQYSTEFGDDKYAFEAYAEFSVGDSRVDPTVSFVLSDGQEVTDFSDVACAISQIKLNFGTDMDAETFTDESLKLIDVESEEELPYDGEYVDGEGIYVITPTVSFIDGRTYSLELSELIKYQGGREILAYSYEFTIPSYDYYKQDFNGMLYSTLDAWAGAKNNPAAALDDFASSPIVGHYGVSTWPNIGYDGTDALYLCICYDGSYYTGDGGYGTFQFKNDYKGRNVDIPVSKNLESTGIYSMTCDYYPSAGTESFNIRGNQNFPDGYNTDNGIRAGQFSFLKNNREREWCTLNITVDLDNDIATITITSKATGEVIYEVSASYTQQLGIISLYNEDTSVIATRAKSLIIDNVEIKRETSSSVVFKDANVSYYAGEIQQTKRMGVNALTDKIEITPDHDIKMGSITSENLYITQGLYNKIDCRLRYENGKIALYPMQALSPETTYVVHIERLENLDGYKMQYPFVQTFKTDAPKLDLGVVAEQSKSLEEIIADREFTVSFSIANSENAPKTLYFVAAYYNEDYSELIGVDCVKQEFAAGEVVSDGEVEFTLPSGSIENVQVAVIDSFGKMTQMCKAIDYK